jgi:hypothetical protein
MLEGRFMYQCLDGLSLYFDLSSCGIGAECCLASEAAITSL